jgi:hypothetical protein
MANIFLSYRRTDGAAACRVREWLVRRLGEDAVFMDVENIPFAVSFPDYVKKEISSSKIVIALIGADWATRLAQKDDQVLFELQLATTNKVPILPVLIGNTPMPGPDQLPQAVRNFSRQNAMTVGILNDFDTHMRLLLSRVESLLGAVARDNVVTANPEIIDRACDGITRFLRDEFGKSPLMFSPRWLVVGTDAFSSGEDTRNSRGTFFLHRVSRLADLLELHFILSFWTSSGDGEHDLAGWVINKFERVPVIPESYFAQTESAPLLLLKIRGSDEDPRQIWRMISDAPLRLSLAYIATIAPR